MSTLRSKGSGQWEFKGFLNLELTEEDKQTFGYWAKPEVDDVRHALNTLISADYKVSVGWSTFEDAYLVAATCKNVESKYYGYCVTCPHEDPVLAIVVMCHAYERDLMTNTLLIPGEQLEIPY